MSNLVEYAKLELDRIGLTEDTTNIWNKAMREHLITMVCTFENEGHSTFSAAYAIGVLNKLLKMEPLCPLTGEDSEWTEVGIQDGILYQNNRCAHVFKDDSGPYDTTGGVYKSPDGNYFTSCNRRRYIEFPYMPNYYTRQFPFIQPTPK